MPQDCEGFGRALRRSSQHLLALTIQRWCNLEHVRYLRTADRRKRCIVSIAVQTHREKWFCLVQRREC